MADTWFFAWGEHKFGPFSTVEMKKLAASGRLQTNDTVWKEGVEAGVLAWRVKNLFAAPAAPTSPPEKDAGEAEQATSTTPADSPPARDFEDVDHEPAPSQEASREITPETSAADAPAAFAPEADAAPAFVRAEEKAEASAAPHTRPKQKAVATGADGAVIVGQDGSHVQYRKKCRKCGYEESSRSSMAIRNGTARQVFYCPKCRKSSAVEIRGKA